MNVLNTVIGSRDKDNPVEIDYTFDTAFADAGGLNQFTSITVDIGDESYSSTGDYVEVVSDTRLRIKIGDQTALDAGQYQIIVTGINGNYPNGFEITNAQNPIKDNSGQVVLVTVV